MIKVEPRVFQPYLVRLDRVDLELGGEVIRDHSKEGPRKGVPAQQSKHNNPVHAAKKGEAEAADETQDALPDTFLGRSEGVVRGGHCIHLVVIADAGGSGLVAGVYGRVVAEGHGGVFSMQAAGYGVGCGPGFGWQQVAGICFFAAGDHGGHGGRHLAGGAGTGSRAGRRDFGHAKAKGGSYLAKECFTVLLCWSGALIVTVQVIV